MTTVTRQVHFTNRSRRKVAVPTPPPEPPPAPTGRIPRISKLMALAIRFDQLLREGKVTDQSELARLAHVTQPRMTQIMNLLHLAPDIQEELLHLPPVVEGRDPIHERMLRLVVAEVDWVIQWRGWTKLRPEAAERSAAGRSRGEPVARENGPKEDRSAWPTVLADRASSGQNDAGPERSQRHANEDTDRCS